MSPQDRALLSGGRAGPGGGRIPGGGGSGLPSSPWAPSSPGVTTRGGGLLAGAGIARAGAFAAALAASPLGPVAGDLVGGALGRSRQIGRDLSEVMGFGAWNRNADVPENATKATVEQLRGAANYASDEQIKALGAINEALAQMNADGETRVRGVLGTKRLESVLEKLSNVLDKLADVLGLGGKKSPGLGGIGANGAGIG